MTPITLPIAELKTALIGLGKIISKTSIAILQNIKIDRTKEGWITLTATDLDRYITNRFEHPSEGPPVSMLVPYEQLHHVVKNCGRNENIEIATTPEGPVIRFALASKTGESKVKPIAVDEFPAIPRTKADPIPLPPEFRRALNEAMGCASTDATRYVLNGVFIDVREPKAHYVVGTDGKHLYSANSFALPLKNSVLIPSHKFLGWSEFLKDGEWQLRADRDHIQISSRRWRFISKQIDGKYPDWHISLPNMREVKTRITIDPERLENLIKLIQRLPCHDERLPGIGIDWSGNQFFLLTKDNEKDPWTRVPFQECKGEGAEQTVFLDRRFLIKALSYGLNKISIIDPMTAVHFSNGGKQMIAMPIRHGDPAGATPQSSPAAQPPPPKKPMPPTLTPTRPPAPRPEPSPAPNGTTVETTIQMALQLRDVLQDAGEKLRGLVSNLRQIDREQKSASREINSVRSTLRSLQTLKL